MSLGKIFKKMTNQSGRTMTEILGVLVIIGVLSLTALLGFSYAMEAVRENETLNRAAKIIAAARTGYILQDHGYNTKYYVDEDKVERLYDEYQPQSINMHDVISNIGDDFSDDDTYILAPLKGPFKDGNEQNVKIYVRVETPFAFTVRFDNLTKQACMKIVMARNLGYSWGYETADAAAHWMDPTMLMNEANAESLCNRVVGLTSSDSATLHELFLNNPFVKQAFAQTSSASGTLVLWFGPYSTLDPEGAYPSCADSDCCCDLDDEGNLYLVGRAGCSRPAYGTCVSCTYENSEGICVQKDGVTCPASDVCGETKCQSGQFECGDVCCLKGQTCNDGVCEGDPDAGYCADTQTQCGDNCCNEGEICNDDGECVVDPCPASEGKFWCVQDKVCCNANEKCQNAQCIQVCDDNQTLCGDICCEDGYQCKESCGNYTCVPKCAAGETLYCSHDTDFVTTDTGTCRIYSSCCDEWSCTNAPLLLQDTNTPPRQLEVPVDKSGKYTYCAVVINNKCALITYCDDEPVTLDNGLQICPTCFTGNWSQEYFDTLNQICIGDTLYYINDLTDGEDTLMMFTCDDLPLGPPLCEDDPCPNGGTPYLGGCCYGQVWGPCGTCSAWPTMTDACGRTYALAEICCASNTDAPAGCSSLKEGQCYTNYPINDRAECCSLACLDEDGEETCCEKTDATEGVCCNKDDPRTELCCKFKGRTWCGATCCTEGQSCIGELCTTDSVKTCEDLGGVSGYDTVPTGSQVMGEDGEVIEGCCLKSCACPDECCDATKKHCLTNEKE